MLKALYHTLEEFFRIIRYYPVIKQVVLVHSELLIRFRDLSALILLLLLVLFNLSYDTVKDLSVVVRKLEVVEGILR